MNHFSHLQGIQQTSLIIAALILFAMGWSGCGTKGASRQRADEFKKEVKEACQDLTSSLLEAVSQ